MRNSQDNGVKDGEMYYGYCGPSKRHLRRLSLLRRMAQAKHDYVQTVKAKMQPAYVIYMSSHISRLPSGAGEPQVAQLKLKPVRKPRQKAAPVVDVIVKATQHVELKQPAKPRSRAKKPPANAATA